MLKKIAKITGITLGVLLIAAFAIPYFFKDQIKARIEKALNESVNATVSFADAEVSLFRNFPKATVSIEKMAIINKAPFEGDTLVAFESLALKLSVMELFNEETEPMQVDAIATKNGLINVILNKEGIGNYDIALKKPDEKGAAEESKPLSFKIKSYEIENYRFRFTDQASNMKVVLDSIQHTGVGDFSNDVLDLDTHTSTNVSFSMDKANYMRNIPVSLDAILGLDLKQSKYSFKKNEAKINDLPLKFNGFIQLLEKAQVYDLTFETPTSDFKNFLGLIPAAYRSNIDNVKTTGQCSIKGFAKGQLTETSIPRFSVAIASNNASFQYPNLPKAIKNIHIDTKIVNETGQVNDTYVNLNRLSFAVDQDVFDAKATLKNIAENALVNAQLKGVVNLANFSKAYPIAVDKPLSGIIKADVSTEFDMAAVEKSDYARIKNEGEIDLTGFRYTDESGKTMDISKVLVAFNPSRVVLKEFKAKTGKSDLGVSGVLENFYGYLFRNQNLEGNFTLTSNQIAVSDFMTTEKAAQSETAKNKEPLKIPAFLDCTLTAKANTVLYDNLTLKNCAGKLIIKDQKVTLENVKTNIFGGQITFNGDVSTQTKVPTFAMDLGLNQVDIAQTFTQLEMFKKVAPIAGVINGKFNSTVQLKGSLNAIEMTPDLKSLNGDLMGQLLSTTVNSNNSKLLQALDGQLKFIDLNKLNLNNLKTALHFENGRVTLKPFDLNYQDIKVSVNGSHGFDQTLRYGLTLDVPAKYLGREANALLAKLSPAEINALGTLPINATIAGNFTNPIVTTDLKAATTTLANRLAQQQKNKLVDKTKNEIGRIIDRNTKPGDTAKASSKEAVKNKAGDLLKGLLGKKK